MPIGHFLHCARLLHPSTDKVHLLISVADQTKDQTRRSLDHIGWMLGRFERLEPFIWESFRDCCSKNIASEWELSGVLDTSSGRLLHEVMAQ